MPAAIEVRNIGKRYRLGARAQRFDTLRDRLAHSLRSPLARMRAVASGYSTNVSDEHIWAVRDVSLEVAPGEVLGLVGRNGAGKTTLLKILSRITEPTTGSAVIRGRVGSLLEVGTGFHPDLTGRENIQLNGAILGMRREEISARFDEIVAFAEVERFIDTQVKHYSSGMHLRLAFAVAAHLEPEILLVDEVLAVGDAAFQRKCLGKMGDVSRSGRTILFVSHNMEAVERLCHRCVWLEDGAVEMDGPPNKVISAYLAESAGEIGATYSGSLDSSDRAILVQASILDADSQPTETIKLGEPFSISMAWRHREAIQGSFYFIRIYDHHGRLLISTNNQDQPLDARIGDNQIVCRLPTNGLVPGDYSLTIGCFLPPRLMIHLAEECLSVRVLTLPFSQDLRRALDGALFAVPTRWTRVESSVCPPLESDDVAGVSTPPSWGENQ